MVFSPLSPPQSSLTLNSPGDIPSSIKADFAIRSAPYPNLLEARTITIPLVLREQKHPKIPPSERSTWTEKQRAAVSSVIAKPSNNAKSLKDIEKLVSEYAISFTMINFSFSSCVQTSDAEFAWKKNLYTFVTNFLSSEILMSFL
jgi:hypothetical protein